MSMTDDTPQPATPPPPAPKKPSVFKKRIAKLPVWLWTIIVLLVLFIALGASGGSETPTESAEPATTAAAEAATDAGSDAAAEEPVVEEEPAQPTKLTSDRAQDIGLWNAEVADEMLQFSEGMQKCGNLADIGGSATEITDCAAEAYDGYEEPAYLLIDELRKAGDELAPGPCRRALLSYRSIIAQMSGTMKIANDALQNYDLEAFSVAADLYASTAGKVSKRAERFTAACI